MEPSASCVTKSGLRREKTLAKGAGHHRRLWSEKPQLQQRPLYTCLAAGVLSEEGCPQGQFSVESMVCYSTNNRVILVIKGPDAIIDAEGVPTRVNR